MKKFTVCLNQINLGSIALGRTLDGESNVFVYVEDENGLVVFSVEVDFHEDFNSFHVKEKINFYERDEQDFVISDCLQLGGVVKFSVYDFMPKNCHELGDDESLKEADKKRDSVLMKYLEQRFQELKALEVKGELESYLEGLGLLNYIKDAE